MPVPQFLKTQAGDYILIPPVLHAIHFSTDYLQGSSESAFTEAVLISLTPGNPIALFEMPCDVTPPSDATCDRAQIILDTLVQEFVRGTTVPNPVLDMVAFVQKNTPQFARKGAS